MDSTMCVGETVFGRAGQGVPGIKRTQLHSRFDLRHRQCCVPLLLACAAYSLREVGGPSAPHHPNVHPWPALLQHTGHGGSWQNGWASCS